MTTSYKFGTLHLRVIGCFCRILEVTVFKGSLLHGLLFKSEIGPAFVKKVSGARGISGKVRS